MEKFGYTAVVVFTSLAIVSSLAIYYFGIQRNIIRTFLDGKEMKMVKLIDKKKLTDNTFRFRFQFSEKSDHLLGLPVGLHLYLVCQTGDEEVKRPYTPVEEGRGWFDLVVKIYRAGENPKFPKGGRMSQLIDKLKVGDIIGTRGPIGKIEYVGNGGFKNLKSGQTRYFKTICMIAGGTGITPLYQVMQHILDKEATRDYYQFHLLFANQTPDDILLKDELDETVKKYPNRVSVKYAVDRVTEQLKNSWDGYVGYITEEMIKGSFSLPSDDTTVLLCGPLAMIENSCQPALGKLGYKNVLVF